MTAAPLFKVDAVRPSRYSMSFLRAAGDCLRRAHFERIEDGAREDAVIGHILHEIASTTGFAVTMRGDTHPRDGEVMEIARRVMAAPEGRPDPLSRTVWEEVLELCAQWERTAEFHPEERFEVDLRNDLDGRTLSARLDSLRVDGPVAWVKDYKSGWGEPLGAPKPTPQGDNYAWHCWRTYGVTTVMFRQDHVRWGPGEWFEYTLDAILLIDAFLRDQVARVDAAYAKGGELPTNPGDACSKWDGCPVAVDCPVKKWARPATVIQSQDEALAEFAALVKDEASVTDRKTAIQAWFEREALHAVVTSEDDAVQQLAALLVEEASVAQRKKQIRGWIARSGIRSLQLNGQEIGYSTDAGTKTDWKGLAQSLNGDPKDFTTTAAPSFGRRKAKS